MPPAEELGGNPAAGGASAVGGPAGGSSDWGDGSGANGANGANGADGADGASANGASIAGGTVGASGTGGTDVRDEAARGELTQRRRRHSARWAAGIALLALAVVVAVLATRPSYQATEAISPLVGHRAPAVAGTTVDGAPFDLASYRGRWVVLNFFASWCVPCQQEEPNLVAFAYQHRQPGGAALVGVVFEDTNGAARAFQRSQGATWPTLTDPGTRIALAYGVTSPPETFLISPTGMVAAHIYGAVTQRFLDQQLARAEQAFG